MPGVAIRDWIRNNVDARFVKGVGVLLVGNIVGQGLVICSYPILARLFSPKEFGVLAVYTATISLFSVVAALRYELAIPLPPDERLGASLLVLSLSITAAMSTLIAITVLLFGHWMIAVTHVVVVSSYLWLLPLGLFSAGCYQVLTNWALRQEMYYHIAQSRVAQGIAQAASQLLFGLLRFGPIGLLLGDFLGQSIGDATIGIASLRGSPSGVRGISLRTIADVARRYRRFPLFSSWAAILNTGSLQLPPILFSILYGPEVAGWFSLSWRAVLIPAAFVGEAVSQVYSATASKLVRENRVGLSRLFYQMSLGLLAVGIVPAAFITVLGPDAFRIVFGSAWRESGVYVQLLSAALLAQFVVGSLSRTLAILERQTWQLAWDAGRFVIILIGLLGVAHLGLPSRFAVAVYSVSLLGSYLVFFVLSTLALRSTSERRQPA